jgi:hypothetical protein
MLVPALAAWIAAGGPVSVPSAVLVSDGAAQGLLTWGASNGPAIFALASFTLVHHGATRHATHGGRVSSSVEIGIGYVTAIVALATAGAALAAGIVALLFVVQAPFRRGLMEGRVRWHMSATQWYAMGAMLVAALGIASG